MRHAWRLVLGVSLLVGGGVGAGELNKVTVGDLPGTDARWQAGEVTVAAPADQVQKWLTEVPQWPARFPDDKWAKSLGTAPDGRQSAEFHSKALGRTLTVHMKVQPGLITYDGSGKGVNTQGKIFVESLGPDRTKVVMQTTGELYGATAALASESMKRKRAINKLSADLNAIVKLSEGAGQH
jgi:hypothetical protein